MKFFTPMLLALGALLTMAGCATIQPPQPPSLELPKPPSDLRANRKGDRVTLTWTTPSFTTDRQTIRIVVPVRICRALAPEMTQCGIPVGEAAAQPGTNASKPAKQTAERSHVERSRVERSRVERSYTDSLPDQLLSDNPSTFVTYAVEVLNAAGRGAGLSNQVPVSLARTLPPPHNFAANVTGQGVVLTWQSEIPAPSSGVIYVYRVYRRLDGNPQQNLVGEVRAASEPILTLMDSNIEWEKTYQYHANTVTLVPRENNPDLQIEGDDTPEVKVSAHDIFPPAVPSGLQAVSSGPGQKRFIDLVWAPVTDVDLGGYNIYRREDRSNAVKVSAQLLKTPAYRDDNVMPGKHYFYSVSSVDIRGNESERSEESGETVP